jgi:uncharacterized protein YbjT (DUF2867 family)
MLTEEKKDLLILGATGGTGKALIEAAIERGYHVTAFVRDVQHAKHLFNNLISRMTFFEGDALNPDDIQHAIGKGPHAVISALGIYHRRPGHDELTQATVNALNSLNDVTTRRFVCVSSIGIGESAGQGDLITRIIQKTSLRHTLPDKETQEQAIRATDLDWTIIRPSRLMNGNGPEHFTTWTGPQPNRKLIWQINRADVAAVALDCLENDASINQAINVTGCRQP